MTRSRPSIGDEPFRLLFPVGILLAWTGVGHWVAYRFGWIAEYSCELHGLVMTQGFLTAFALGFLGTALPRRTASPRPGSGLVAAVAAGLGLFVGLAHAGRWAAAEGVFALLAALALGFAVRGMTRGGRRPPACFVAIPAALATALAGAVLIGVGWRGSVSGDAAVFGRWLVAGRLLVEQGLFLGLILGVMPLLWPLVAGGAPLADGLGGTHLLESLGWLAAQVGLVGTLVAEALGSERAAPLLRAGLAAAAVGAVLGTTPWPRKPGLHRRLVWVALVCLPAGLGLSGLWPAYRVPFLHVTLIGGFSLLALGVGYHVALGHGGREDLLAGSTRSLRWLTGALALALLTRVVADLTRNYFDHLAWAAICWWAASVAWLVPALRAILSGPGDASRREAR